MELHGILPPRFANEVRLLGPVLDLSPAFPTATCGVRELSETFASAKRRRFGSGQMSIEALLQPVSEKLSFHRSRVQVLCHAGTVGISPLPARGGRCLVCDCVPTRLKRSHRGADSDDVSSKAATTRAFCSCISSSRSDLKSGRDAVKGLPCTQRLRLAVVSRVFTMCCRSPSFLCLVGARN